jgi:hypothetical protein
MQKAFDGLRELQKWRQEMRIITTAIVTICAMVCGFAQTPSPSPENWQTLTPAAEDFSVEAPLEMNLFRQHPKRDLGRIYFNDLNGTYFRIFSEKRSEAHSIEKGLEFIRRFEKKGSGVAFGPIKAEKFDFEDDEKFFHRVIYLETSSRAYLFHTISENRDDNAAKRFLRSLQIAGRPMSGAGTGTGDEFIWPAHREAVASGTRSSTTAPAAQKETAAATTGRTGDGQGSDRGTWPFDREGAASGAPPSTTAPAGATQNVKILSKPRASYTDLARTYSISGTVTLRITFLASGEIGAVTPVTRVPFGLTGQAIAAARAITFEPAQKSGYPFTKMMTVQYGFTIY